jgi:hypothetical protein
MTAVPFDWMPIAIPEPLSFAEELAMTLRSDVE